MMRRIASYLCCILLVLTLAACGEIQNLPRATQAPTPSPPAPQAGKAVVVGRVVSNTTQQPITKTVVYLAQVYWDSAHENGAFALDLANSPASTTDEQGYFAFSDLEPGEYVLVVGDYYGENDIVRESNGDARIYQTEPGKVLDTGTVQVKPNVSPGR